MEQNNAPEKPGRCDFYDWTKPGSLHALLGIQHCYGGHRHDIFLLSTRLQDVDWRFQTEQNRTDSFHTGQAIQ
jgi:hypothetical protein